MPRPDDLVGYTYRADNYCGADIGERLAEVGEPVNPAEVARVVGEPECAELAETMLDELAELRGLNREDETTFDSGHFPKVYFRDAARDSGAECAVCGRALADLDKIPTNVRS